MRISYWSSDVVLFRSFDGYSVGAIDCTADRRFAYSFRDGARLASQHRLVEARSPFKNVAVHRHLGARTDQHVVARHQGRDRDFLGRAIRSEEHTSELQSLMRISYAVFCLKKKNKKQ